jgi:hypothetical protein
LLQHPQPDVPNTEDEEQTRLWPAILFRPGGDEPQEPDDRSDDAENNRDGRDVMHV